MISHNHKRYLIFSNDEIRTYFIDELEKAKITCSCIVGERYVDKYVSKDYDYITFDGEMQEFFISFSQCEVSIFINEEEIMFIDDNEKKFYTIEDTYENIVYEGSLNDLSHDEILKKLVSIVKLLYGTKELKILKSLSSNQELLYPRYNYKLIIKNPVVKSGIYKFDNIIFEINP